MNKLLWIVLWFISLGMNAQLNYKYRVSLSDKQANYGMLSHPETLLSQRALERRARFNISLDTCDLPVSATYLTELSAKGYVPVCTSRWLNSVVVASVDSLAEPVLKALPFVTDARRVWKDNSLQKSFFIKQDESSARKITKSQEALIQLTALRGDRLHQAGYQGEEMMIAVIDAGFLNVDKIPSLYERVLGTRDFVDPSGDIYATHFHGTNVLSIMASPATPDFSGTAPNARYWLLRSEDSSSEFPVEEDYWVAAAEYADSLGVDVINSSLGYSQFDDSSMNHIHEEINGRTTVITRGAGMAAAKGILVVNSAGNDGQHPWRRINFPADQPAILTVGAMTPTLQAADFTAVGLIDGSFVKPNVAGIGAPAYVIDVDGQLVSGSGTSFSTPAVAGLAACLWQALPRLTNQDIIRLLEQHANHAEQPDSLSGYGIPDVYAAYQQATGVGQLPEDSPVAFLPLDSTLRVWQVEGLPCDEDSYILQVVNLSGELVRKYRFKSCSYIFNLNQLPPGLYITTLMGAKIQYSQRIHLTKE